MEQEIIDKLRRIYKETTNEVAREGAKKKLQDAGIPLTAEATPSEPKKKTEPKATKPKSEPRAKAEPKAEPKSSSKSDNDTYCDELIAEAKKRKAKAKANAQKRANAPKKSPSTKTKEAVEKTATRVEKSVETRAKKGEVKVEELEKLIAEYQDAIKKLQALLSKVKSGKKFAQGGKMGVMDAESSKEYHKIKDHSCGCGDKMAKGGAIEHGLEVGDKIYYKTDNLIIVEKNGENFFVNINNGKRLTSKEFYAMSDKDSIKFSKMAKGGGIKTFKSNEKNMGMIYLKFANPKYNYSSSNTNNFNESEAREHYVGKMVNVSMTEKRNMQKILDIVLVCKYAKGGELIGKQKNLDQNKNGIIDSEDLKMIRENKMARGGGVKARTTFEVDRHYSALKEGKRESRKYANVEMRGGAVYHRRNANQYGKTKGGNTYYEHHENRIDSGRFLADGGNIENLPYKLKARIKKHIYGYMITEKLLKEGEKREWLRTMGGRGLGSELLPSEGRQKSQSFGDLVIDILRYRSENK